MRIYLDTPALIKAYLSEPGSDAVRSALVAAEHTYISSLNVSELRGLLARRALAGDFDATAEQRLWTAFQTDLLDGVFDFVAIEPDAFVQAAALIGRVAPAQLRTLDALHLTIAEHIDPDRFFTTDRQLALAAQTIGLTVDTLES